LTPKSIARERHTAEVQGYLELFLSRFIASPAGGHLPVHPTHSFVAPARTCAGQAEPAKKEIL